MGIGALGIFRYAAMAAFAGAGSPGDVWPLRHVWYASSLSLTIPSIFAVDQLVRHPAMTPRKLLGYAAPFLTVYLAVIIVGRATGVPDRLVGGWMPRLTPGWQWLLVLTQCVFVTLFIGFCIQVMRRVPSRPIRLALAGLVLAHAYLGLDGILMWIGRPYVRPYLYSEMFACLALWHAYETAAKS